MHHVKPFGLFENNVLTPEQIQFLNKYCFGNWNFDPETGLVDVDGDFICKNVGIQNLRGIRFGKILDDWDCAFNQLTSLEGSPREVGGLFRFSYNRVISLEGSPEIVGGKFSASSNPIVSLKGAPRIIGGIFECNGLVLSGSEWNLEGWLGVLKNGNQKEKNLILTLIGPEALNQEIQENPEDTIMRLKTVWSSPDFASIKKDLVIPDRYKEEVVTLADLNDLGF